VTGVALPDFVTCILATGLCGVMIVAMLEKLVQVAPSIGIDLFFGLTGSESAASSGTAR
jgi:hypothetical protein